MNDNIDSNAKKTVNQSVSSQGFYPVSFQNQQAFNLQNVQYYSPDPILYQMNMYRAIKQIDVEAHIQKSISDSRVRLDIETHKEKLREQYLEKEEEIRLRRESYRYVINENSDGLLLKLVEDSSGKILTGKPLCSARDFKAIVYFSNYKWSSKVTHIFWNDKKTERGIYFQGTQIPTNKFINKLKSAGISFKTSTDNAKRLYDDVLAYLMNEAEYIEIPRTRGWNLIDGKWLYATEDEITLQEVMKNV